MAGILQLHDLVIQCVPSTSIAENLNHPSPPFSADYSGDCSIAKHQRHGQLQHRQDEGWSPGLATPTPGLRTERFDELHSSARHLRLSDAKLSHPTEQFARHLDVGLQALGVDPLRLPSAQLIEFVVEIVA
jgi:hypothetical protein